MQRRELGKTGQQLSVIGFGGIVVRDTTPAEAARYVGEAVDAGVNYFDVAPSYGNSEERLGPALEPYREQVFLACKTAKRTRDEAALELRQSLAKLKTDHFDLYQLHALTSDEDIERAFGPGGAVEELVEARALGLVKHLGFSAHSDKAAVAALERFEFDSVLFPVNYFSWTNGQFGHRIMETAVRQGVGRLALKAMALGKYVKDEQRPFGKCWYQPLDNPALVAPAVRWSLAQPITAAVSPGHIELLRLAIAAVNELRAPEAAEMAALAGALQTREPVFAG
ncbi:MAG: aldo/keto reductase [Fimbriimonadaceae bacterium]|nr:aldo/keto reductase [Fimbriimonadaceae bacterium]